MASPYQERRRRWLETIRAGAQRHPEVETVPMPLAQLDALASAALQLDALVTALDAIHRPPMPEQIAAGEALRRLAEVAS